MRDGTAMAGRLWMVSRDGAMEKRIMRRLADLGSVVGTYAPKILTPAGPSRIITGSPIPVSPPVSMRVTDESGGALL